MRRWSLLPFAAVAAAGTPPAPPGADAVVVRDWSRRVGVPLTYSSSLRVDYEYDEQRIRVGDQETVVPGGQSAVVTIEKRFVDRWDGTLRRTIEEAELHLDRGEGDPAHRDDAPRELWSSSPVIGQELCIEGSEVRTCDGEESAGEVYRWQFCTAPDASRLLPTAPVLEGDTWDFPDSDLHWIVSTGGHLGIEFPEGAPGVWEFLLPLYWHGLARDGRLVGITEVTAVRDDVVELRLTGSWSATVDMTDRIGEVESPPDAGGEVEAHAASVSIDLELESDVVWNRELAVLEQAESRGRGRLELSVIYETEGGRGETVAELLVELAETVTVEAGEREDG